MRKLFDEGPLLSRKDRKKVEMLFAHLKRILTYIPHIVDVISREFLGVVVQPRNAASGTPSSSSVWFWMPVSSGRKT